MTQASDPGSVPAGKRSSRRKWGWVFLSIFVVQFILLGVLIGGTIHDIERIRGVRTQFIESGSRDLLINHMSNQIMGFSNLLYGLIAAAVVCSAVTLTGAVLFLRRR